MPCSQLEEDDLEAEAAEGMTQLAASRSAPASSSFGNVAANSPMLALGRSLTLMSNQIPQEVLVFLLFLPDRVCLLQPVARLIGGFSIANAVHCGGV